VDAGLLEPIFPPLQLGPSFELGLTAECRLIDVTHDLLTGGIMSRNSIATSTDASDTSVSRKATSECV
jgi:hypothetical protein